MNVFFHIHNMVTLAKKNQKNTLMHQADAEIRKYCSCMKRSTHTANMTQHNLHGLPAFHVIKLLPSPWWGDHTQSTSQPSAGNQSTAGEMRRRFSIINQQNESRECLCNATSTTQPASDLTHEYVMVLNLSIEGAVVLLKWTWKGFFHTPLSLSWYGNI